MNPLTSFGEMIGTIMPGQLSARLALTSIEMAALAGIVWGVLKISRVRSARTHAVLWSLVLAKGILGVFWGSPLQLVSLRVPPLPVVAEVAGGGLSEEQRAKQAMDLQLALSEAERSFKEAGRISPERSVAEKISGSGTPSREESSRVTVPAAWIKRLSASDWTVGLWLAGVFWMLFLTGMDFLRARRLRRGSGEPSADLQALFVGEAERYGIARLPRLLVTDRIESPALIGLLRPAVVVPTWILEDKDSRRLRWVLDHELMHVKMKDPIGLLIRRLAQILLWFHPVTWWAGRRWEEATELACDRALVERETEARDYAESLYHLLEGLVSRSTRTRLSSGLYATKTQVGKRIAVLLSNRVRCPARLSKPTLAGLIAIVLISLSIGIGFSLNASERVPPSADQNSESAISNAGSEKELQEKIDKVKSQLRNLEVSMEAYCIDNNTYPGTLTSLTTPIAYTRRIPEDPFALLEPGATVRLNVDTPDFHPIVYSVGPDGVDQKGEVVYNPEKGIKSEGDIIRRLEQKYLSFDDESLKKQIYTEEATVEDLKGILGAWYAENRGALPKSLDVLTTPVAYVDRIPEDLFASGHAVAYRLDDNGEIATIYSFGPDGDDDGGKKELVGRYGKGDLPDGDIFVEVRLSELRRKFPEEPLTDENILDHVPDDYSYQRAYLAELLKIKAQEGRDNAMIHYVVAGWMYPGVHPDNYLWNLFNKTLESGWSPALKEIRKGASVDYAIGIGNTHGLATPVPNYLAGQTACNVLCIEGRRLESQGRFADAMDNYLVALTMGRDYGATGSALDGHLISANIQDIALNQIRRLVSDGVLDSKTLKSTLSRLKEIEKTTSPIADGFRVQGDMLQTEIEKMRSNPPKSTDWIEKGQGYDPSADPQAWSKEVDRMLSDRKEAWDFLMNYVETPAWELDQQDFKQELETKQKNYHYIVRIAIPNVVTAKTRFLVTQSGRLETELATALAIYKAEQGRYPESLEGLLPGPIGEKLPVDPFSGKNYLYRCASGGDAYQLWSQGPDGRDNMASVAYDATNGTFSDGDLVHQAFGN